MFPSEDNLDLIMSMEGMLSREEAALLYWRASQATRAIIEIGSYRGRSTVALALGSKAGHGVPVYAIDPHEDFTEPGGFHFGRADAVAFAENILRAGVADVVRVVQLPSDTIGADESNLWADLLWIDGDHERVWIDFRRYWSCVYRNGYILLHDRTLKAVAEVLETDFEYFRRLDDCGQIAQLERIR